MNREEIITRLQAQKQHLKQELTQRILHIENISKAIDLIEGREVTQPSYPPHNPFEGVPIARIDTETYLTIGRCIVENKNNVRTLGEVEQIIRRLDNTAEQLIGTRDPQSLSKLHRIQDDRDRLRIELEFYKDIIEALQTDTKKITQEEIEEGKYNAREPHMRRYPDTGK